jgi:hypothetical protein
MRTISREVASPRSQEVALTPQRLNAELLEVTVSGSRAYLLGALHDATISVAHRTVRFGQRDREWLSVVAHLLGNLGQKSWTHREGKDRAFWVLESSAKWLVHPRGFVDEGERLLYARGYFDAEGGVPRDANARFYVQFVQKNLADLSELRDMLELAGIRCGKLHNPSVSKAPSMWRFFVRSESHLSFVRRVSSWHPRKRHLLDTWRQGREPGW